jgi:hypothetical protein
LVFCKNQSRFPGVSKLFYNRRYFLNFRRYLKKIRLRAARGPEVPEI